MPDINRVFTHIDGYIDSGGGEHIDILSKVIGKAIEGAKRGYVDRDFEDQALIARIDSAKAELERLGEVKDTADLIKLKSEFREAAIEAMACRRSVLPLKHHENFWETVDPRETLFDDEDQYAFAIYDTLADEIAKLLPALEQIALECSWESDDDTC